MPRQQNHFGLPHWVMHDLRRTASTRMRELGADPNMVERILNHLPSVLIRTYDRADYTEPMRQALNLWADDLKIILEAENE